MSSKKLSRTDAALRLYAPAEPPSLAGRPIRGGDAIGNPSPTKPGYIENLDQMRFRARYGEDGPDPRWPSLRLENLREVSARPAIAVADVHLSEHRQRLLDVALCTDGSRYWAALPPGFEPADTTVGLGYQASIVLEFLAELGMTE